MRPAVLAALLCLAALVAGCGGSEVQAEEVPGGPVTVALPSGTDPADVGDDDTDADSTADADADSTGDDADAPTPTDPGTAVAPTDTGAAAAPVPEATAAPAEPQEDPAATGGADADAGLDQFCADNPGAC